MAFVCDGAPIANVGAVLSSVKVVDGPAAGAKFPPIEAAVPAAIEMPTVPSPEQLCRVTVRVVVPAPLTDAAQAAEPVVLTVMSEAASETVVALP